jgi:hypothetical protein
MEYTNGKIGFLLKNLMTFFYYRFENWKNPKI